MTSSQDTLAKLEEAMHGLRSAQDALGQIPGEIVPQVTIDGLQHEFIELETRLRAVLDDLAPTREQTSPDQE